MDGVSPNLPMPPTPGGAAYVPPPPGGFAPAPMQQPQQQQPQPARQPVGRPSGDPDQQEQRVERSQLRQRLRNILPSAMTDGRIAIFRLEGRKGRNRGNSGKSVMQILFRDLEKALTDGTYTDTGDYVKDQLKDKYGDKGRFLWEAQDNRGRTMPDAGETEVDLSDGADDSNDEEITVDDTPTHEAPLSDLDQRPQFFQGAPPPPEGFDAAAHARTVQEMVREEKKGAESMVTVMMTMMQAQMQQQQMATQAQMQQAEARRLEEDRRREREESKEREERKLELERLRIDMERREKEDQRREERDRDRRKDEMQMQMQFFQAIMGKPDTTTPMLMKMIESKGDREGTKELFALMGEASRQSMMQQGEATKHLMSQQAEAAKTMMANVMGVSQAMVQQMVESQAEPTDDPMEKVARIFKMIAPALGAIGQSPPAIQPQPQQQPQPRIAQQPNAQRQQQQVPPAEWIKGGLYTIMRLETGEIPVQQRWQALKWCSDNLPKQMLDAIRSGVEDTVLGVGAQGMDENLLGWIADERHAQFLRDCIADIQRILLGALTQADVQASLEKHSAYMQAKGTPMATPATAAEAAIPAEVSDADLAQPAPSNGKRRAPPPAEPKATPEPPPATAAGASQAP